eukprot:Skav202693  [mRNA]  locus=scaffold654:23232:23486:- [translate_table: standard]
MGSAASAVPRLQACNRGISAERYCVEDVEEMTRVQSCPIPAVDKADQRFQPTRVFAFDAEEWQMAFGHMRQDFTSNSESQESQD